MKLRDARKLHNGDQVQIKDAGEFVDVIKAYPCSTMPNKFHCIDAMTSDGYQTLSHLDIR